MVKQIKFKNYIFLILILLIFMNMGKIYYNGDSNNYEHKMNISELNVYLNNASNNISSNIVRYNSSMNLKEININRANNIIYSILYIALEIFSWATSYGYVNNTIPFKSLIIIVCIFLIIYVLYAIIALIILFYYIIKTLGDYIRKLIHKNDRK